MSRPDSLRTVDPFTLPHVWRVDDLAAASATVPTGHEALDAQLPGGGWPRGCVVEVLQRAPAQHVWRLVLPALVRIMGEQPGPAVLVGAPMQPFAPSLAAQGLDPQRLLCVQADQPALRLWAAEQALRCAQVAAVLAWLPVARNEELRRLQLASQQHDRLLFVFRTLAKRHESSPASLRLELAGIDEVEIRILKRRGPPLASSIAVPAGPSRLMALLNARRGSRSQAALPAVVERSHVLDRTAAVQ